MVLNAQEEYGKGNFEIAIDLYTQAIEEAHEDNKKSIQWSNCAQARLQLRDYKGVITDSTHAIDLDNANFKAYISRSVANESLERFQLAVDDLETILTMKLPNNLLRSTVNARKRILKNIEQDKKVAAFESKEANGLVHEHQGLRLNFSHGFPLKFELGIWYTASVYIANEFGLFRRSSYPAPHPLELTISLLDYKRTNCFEIQTEDSVVMLHEHGKTTFRFKIISTQPSSAIASSLSLRVEIAAPEYSILSVLSTPIGILRTEEPIDTSLGIHCLRALPSAVGTEEIILGESPGQVGIGGKIWDSSIILAKYLFANPSIVQDKHVIELGSGLGYMGLCCALLGAHVVVTDMTDVMPLLAYNINLNSTLYQTKLASSGGSIQAIEHTWGTSLSNMIPDTFDLTLLCDVVYDPEGYLPLISSLVRLKSEKILMAHRSRNPKEGLFFKAAAEQFVRQSIPFDHEILRDIQLMYLL